MLLATTDLIAGMILYEDLSLDIDDFSFPKGHILTSRDIVRIHERGIKEVKIKIGDKYNTFSSSFNNLVRETISSNDFEKISKLSIIYEDIITANDILLYDIGSYLNQENYNHLVNTTNIAVIITKKYNELVNKEDRISIKDIALASLLQDIGRNAKEPFILNRLKNKYEAVINSLCQEYSNIDENIFVIYNSKFHPVYSYLLTLNYDINDDVRKAILLHHEKESGENSLLGKTFKELGDETISINMARILKLADLYDILLAKNTSEKESCPFKDIGKQIDKMVASGFVNALLTNILKTMIPIYQVGMKVLLSDQTIGQVEANDPNNYGNPIVTDLSDNYIDLEKENLTIIKHYYD